MKKILVVMFAVVAAIAVLGMGCSSTPKQPKAKLQAKPIPHKKVSGGTTDLGSVHAKQIIVHGVPYTNSVALP